MQLDKIVKPTLLVNEEIARQNIARMAKKAANNQVAFRPHFKTHFSQEIGNWYRDAGVTKITCSSIDMAMYFAQNGWKDITIAFPVNVRQMEDLNDLAERITLNLVVESLETVAHLNKNLKRGVNLFIKIDTGYGRTGLKYDQLDLIKSVANEVHTPHKMTGLLAHFGHTYKLRSAAAIRDVYKREVARLLKIKHQLNWKDCTISIGDTPGCSVVDSFDHVDEIRPGNFVFYDLMQVQIGSCSMEDIAVCLAVPIVAIHSDRRELVVHGGAVHLSKERLADENGTPFFGKVVALNPAIGGWDLPAYEMLVKSISQEHGIISVGAIDINQFQVGGLLGLLPVHSCLTANLTGGYQTTEGAVISTLHARNKAE